ncbi:hypothetical protein [Bythopirellula polymerisocia]|uniref:Uncharacterized protein n=1 Tax=Bythopirellula polymerisocia TaxID=2528003 RepID=A0A5C6C9D6_9BACT|nr:hypothetical protein [Bythopirellula polymerisocia]TWU20768.1 hypothetical protein Pla144_48190 [Bythopirellula polymerisocia]
MSNRALALAAVAVVVFGSTIVTLAQRPRTSDGPRPQRPGRGAKPEIEDTKRLNVYADNWFLLYINSELVAVDSIRFMPHNVISVDVFPEYPMTIAVMAKDNADTKTGMEYNNTQIGDGGFILKLADGTVTGKHWKAKSVSHGPINGDTDNPHAVHEEIPDHWFAVDFDDRSWKAAKEYAEQTVRPKRPFYQHDFEGAKFIWADDLELDNTVLFRLRVDSPPDGSTPKTFPILLSK